MGSVTISEDEKVDAYNPGIQFRQRDPRFAEQERFKDGKQTDAKPSPFSAADFSYDESKRVYLCPNGKELKCHARNQVNLHRTYDVYQARAEDCAVCPLRSRCLSKSDTSSRYLSIQVDTGQPNLIDLMKAKIDSEQGKKIYARRLVTLAPHAVQVLSSRSLPTFVCINTWIVSPCVPNVKWMYNGYCSLWYTISARSTCSGR